MPQTARMGRTGGGNGSPPAGLSPTHARGSEKGQSGGASFTQQQQHALSGRARHAMIALPIMLATFALGLQVHAPLRWRFLHPTTLWYMPGSGCCTPG